MRILGVRFKNINSLAGEWEIDFTDPAYTVDGIFAITGPTGAGKTTILDAICLALYGRTPRLERINKSGNDAMTRHTGECSAEITFSTQNGKYRCQWAQHRARKNPEGELQTPRHEISHADTGEIIDNQIRTVAERIVSVTGMDFERFTQSAMLAQGGFAAFLKAAPDERAPILEQITGTAIYSELSMLAYTRMADARGILQLLEAELKGLQLLDPEQEAALKTEEQRLTGSADQQRTSEADARHRYEWKRTCEGLTQKATQLRLDYQQWQIREQDFAAQREKLVRATKALELSEPYTRLSSLRGEQNKATAQLLVSRQKLPALQAQKTLLQQQLQNAESEHQAAEAHLIRMRPVFRQIHLLDDSIGRQAEQQTRLLATLSAHTDELAMQEQKSTALTTAIADKTAAITRQYANCNPAQALTLAENALADESERSRLLGQQLEQHLQQKELKAWRQHEQSVHRKILITEDLIERLQQQQDLKEQVRELDNSIADITSQLATFQPRITDSNALIKARTTAVAALRTQLLQQQTIENLETLRQQLIDGQPCLLCGATDHPFSTQHPESDHSLDDLISEMESELVQSQAALQSMMTQQVRSDARLNHLQEQRQREISQINLHEARLQESVEKLAPAMIPESYGSESHGFSLPDRKNAEVLLQSLRVEAEQIRNTLAQAEQTLEALQTQQQREHQAREQLNTINTALLDIRHLNASLEQSQQQSQSLRTLIQQLGTEISTVEEKLEGQLKQREQLLGTLDPDQEETRLEQEKQQTLIQWQQYQERSQQTDNELRALTQTVDTLQHQISERAADITHAETLFARLLLTQYFEDEAHYLAAVLTEQQRSMLTTQAGQLDQDKIQLESAIRQTQDELTSQLALKLSNESLDDLRQQLSEQENLGRALLEQLGALRQRLRENDEIRQMQASQIQKIDAQKIEYQRWNALNELIGSADGKKFRNFAQGLTFELMISHANQQLRKMTDRYLLLRDKHQPLDLSVIDHYQAGEIRSTRNLSGGESFIVSLALALGLSRMASRNVRVDSLFLDEGFGTLDEDALDTALETLTNLQQEGKLIGVISHIPALKERIGTRIRVSQGNGGRSTLSGPGCRAI